MLSEAIARYVDTGPMVMAWDDTVVRRTGKHVPNTAWRRSLREFAPLFFKSDASLSS